MALKLYCYDFSKRVKSTLRPDNETVYGEYDIVFKQSTNIMKPDFIINTGGIYPTATYCRLVIPITESVNKTFYYFIDSVSTLTNTDFVLHCSLDSLATTKESILASTAFVIYSSSDFNRWLKDDRIPILPDCESTASNATITEHQSGDPVFSATHQNQVCIVSVNNKDMGLTHYVMHEDDLVDIMAALSAAGNSVWASLAQQFGAAIQSIIQIIRLPINEDVLPTTGPYQFILGDQIIAPADPSQPAFSFNVLSRTYIQAKASAGIPAGYLDYRLCEPYQQVKISLPFVGTIDVNICDYREDGDVSFRIAIDLLTGSIVYENDINDNVNRPFASYSGQCGTLIPFVSSQIQNSANIVQAFAGGLAALGVSALTANPMPAVTGGIASIIGGFFTSNQKATSILGSYSGNRGDVLLHTVKCTLIKYKTLFEPNDIKDIEGRPCCQVKALANLTGYCRTQNFQLGGSWFKEIKDEVNALMDSGIYIE